MPVVRVERAAASAALQGNAERVWAALGHDPAGVDTLSERSGLPADAVCVALVELELEGRIAGLPGGLYQRLH
jgi:DNA processing protein